MRSEAGNDFEARLLLPKMYPRLKIFGKNEASERYLGVLTRQGVKVSATCNASHTRITSVIEYGEKPLNKYGKLKSCSFCSQLSYGCFLKQLSEASELFQLGVAVKLL